MFAPQMFLTVWLYWVLSPVVHRALNSPGSAGLMCCSQCGIVCPLFSMSISWVATDLTQDAESRVSLSVCSDGHLENDKPGSWKIFSHLCSDLTNPSVIWKILVKQEEVFLQGTFCISHIVLDPV